MMASVSIDGNILDSIGIRQKGFYSNWGAWTDKKPLKLKFNKYVSGQKYDGLKKINLQNGLHDPSMMRDALSYKFLREAGVPAPRTSFAKVYLNEAYWGLYTIVEQIDKKFLGNWFENKDGDLFKCISNTNLDWQGNLEAEYTDEFELKTNETTSGFTDFIKWVDVINNSGTGFKDSLSAYFETSDYLTILAADIIMLNWDSYYFHGRNFYVYQNPENNKFNWIPWDYNLSFSEIPSELIIDYSQLSETEPKPLVINIQSDDELKNEYFENLCSLINNYFNLEHMEGYIDNTSQMIRPAYLDDPNKLFTIEQFDTTILTDMNIEVPEPFSGDMYWQYYKGIKQFITERNSDVTQQLSSVGYVCDPTTNIADRRIESEYKLYPNPANQSFSIEALDFNEKEIHEIMIIDSQGKTVCKEELNSSKTSIDCSNWRNGIYLCVLNCRNGITTKKLLLAK
jgi:spore coat protein CotH